jgi:hypothetical protein
MTQQEIDQLKQQYGRVYQIVVPAVTKGDADMEFVFKKPDLKIISAVTKLKEKDEIMAMQTLINTCLVSGNKAHLSDPDVFLSISGAFNEVLKVRLAKIKEL